MNVKEKINKIIEVRVPDDVVIKMGEAKKIINETTNLKITNQTQLDNSGLVLRQIKTISKELDEARKSITRPLDEAKKIVMDAFNEPLDFLQNAGSIISDAVKKYTCEVEKKQLEANRLAAAKSAEEEAKKIRSLEERARVAFENGKIEKAEALLEASRDVYVPVVVNAPILNKVEGISKVKTWKYRILNKDLIPREYLEVNEVMIGKLARATQGKIPVPGVEFYCEEVISTRRF